MQPDSNLYLTCRLTIEPSKFVCRINDRMKTKAYLFIVILTLTSHIVSGQNNQPLQTLYSNNSISIESELIDCISTKNGTAKQYQLLQVKNLTDRTVKVTFKKNLWYGGKCTSCNSNSEEYISSVEIEPHGIVSGDCETYDKQLKVFVKMLNLKDVKQLTHFELVDVNVIEL